MTIKIRFHGDKAIIRWKTAGEAMFLKQQMTMFRDSMSNQKMPISVKDVKGREVPKMLLPKPPSMQYDPTKAEVASGQSAVMVGNQMVPAIVKSGEVVHIQGKSPESGDQPVTVMVNPVAQPTPEGGDK